MKTTLALVVALAVIIAGCATVPQGTMEKKDAAMMEQEAAPAVMEKDAAPAVVEQEWTPEEMAAMEKEHEATMKSPANLHDFSQAAFDQAMTDNKVIVLFFNANWCPACQAELPQQTMAFEELTNPDVHGFRVHYKDDQTDDAQTMLAKKYGIAYQHTKVIIKNGKPVLKSPEPWDKARILAEINRVVG